MRIAIGMIVRDILSAHPLTDFLDNAEEHGHALDRVIIVYSHQADPGAVEELRSRTNLSLIKLQSNERAHLIMKEIGVRHSSIHQLLYCPLIDAHGLIPYGFNRNQALMEAMFTGTDYLIFVDSDVRPEVLRKTPDGAVQSEEIDFSRYIAPHHRTGSREDWPQPLLYIRSAWEHRQKNVFLPYPNRSAPSLHFPRSPS